MALGIVEPGGGSDVARQVATTAVRYNDHQHRQRSPRPYITGGMRAN
ncbi:MAG: hypothetical protein IPG64_17795 [Haliea sp.]|nr:hypothetical protein [Haliea sp.]